MTTMKHTGTLAMGVSALAAAPAYASSLPQMDPTWFINQLFWLVISFGVLFIFVSRFVTPAISTILTTRENAISDAIAEAERAKRAAESSRGEGASASQSARAQAAEAMAKAQSANAADAAQAAAKLGNELDRRSDQAAIVLDEALKKARASMGESTQALAEAMAAKLLDQKSAEGAPALKLVAKR